VAPDAQGCSESIRLNPHSIGNPGPDWHIMGTGDYNNDGKSDILWQNSSGAVVVWEMNASTVIGGAFSPTPARPGTIDRCLGPPADFRAADAGG
jgi:hypothetical protein